MANAMYYSAAFHLPTVHARTPLGTLTLRHSGETDIVVTLSTLVANDSTSTSSSWFWHMFHATTFVVVGRDPAATTRYPHFATSSLATALYTYVRGRQTALGWPESDFTATWEEVTFGVAKPYYTFTNGSTFTYQFSTLAGAALFGHTSTALSSGNTFFAFTTAVPTYVVFPSSNKCSATGELDARNYEPLGSASRVIADDGTGYGNKRLVSYRHRDWQQQFEVPEKLEREQAASTHPWTFEDMFDHCASGIPFFVAHGFGASPVPQYPVFDLRDSTWRPLSPSVANHVYGHLDFRTIYVGYLAAPT